MNCRALRVWGESSADLVPSAVSTSVPCWPSRLSSMCTPSWSPTRATARKFLPVACYIFCASASSRPRLAYSTRLEPCMMWRRPAGCRRRSRVQGVVIGVPRRAAEPFDLMPHLFSALNLLVKVVMVGHSPTAFDRSVAVPTVSAHSPKNRARWMVAP